MQRRAAQAAGAAAPCVGRVEVNKGAWRMPWLEEATKDAGSCEKLR